METMTEWRIWFLFHIKAEIYSRKISQINAEESIIYIISWCFFLMIDFLKLSFNCFSTVTRCLTCGGVMETGCRDLFTWFHLSDVSLNKWSWEELKLHYQSRNWRTENTCVWGQNSVMSGLWSTAVHLNIRWLRSSNQVHLKTKTIKFNFYWTSSIDINQYIKNFNRHLFLMPLLCNQRLILCALYVCILCVLYVLWWRDFCLFSQ